jgi:Dolichyl-phosphate-mannose-protein mannosyltransferase
LDAGAPIDARPGRPPAVAAAGVLLLAALLLSVGLFRDWRLLHEDNGALFTTLALSHVRLGLGATRGHDTLVLARTGEARPYGHHPPGVALILAAAFAVSGSDAPAVARSVVIAVHLGSIALALALFGRLLSPRLALAGALFFAVAPMSAFFGRMVGHEPFALCAILLQLLGWTRFRQEGGRGALVLLAAGIVLGGAVAWAPFFFVAALAIVEVLDRAARRTTSAAALVVLLGAGGAVLAFDLAHLAYAGGLASFREVLARDRSLVGVLPLLDSLLGHLEGFRRYFTQAGLVSAIAVAVAVCRPRSGLARALRTDDPVLKPFLAVAAIAPLGWVLAAPAWADVHPYWKFYFLPFTAASVALVVGGLARGVSTRPGLSRSLLVLLALDAAATSAYMLRVRHTRPSDYAVREVANIRRLYLRPSSAPDTP